MRVWRATHIPVAPYRGDFQAVHVVLRDCDLTDTIESSIVSIDTGTDEGFVVHDIFDMPTADIDAATLEAGRRAREREEVERNMATAYFWFTEDIAPMMEEGGVMGTKDPSPLNADDARYVLAWVMRHRLVKSKRLTCMVLDRYGQAHTETAKP